MMNVCLNATSSHASSSEYRGQLITVEITQ